MSQSTSPERIAVIGVDGRPLPGPAQERLEQATLVAGAGRHLEACQGVLSPHARQLVLGDVDAGLCQIAAHDGPVAVLASGDPGFFGILRRLASSGLSCDVFPAVGSVAHLAARAGLPWDDAVVASAHGRGVDGLRRAVNACRAFPKVAVFTAAGSGPAELGAALAGRPRRLVVGERLGTPQETLSACSPAEAATRDWADPNVVLVIRDDERAGGHTVPAPLGSPRRQVPAAWALEETAFDRRDGMITKSEVRAIALARLGPGIGDLVWDVGAGSGSVSVECARFGAAVTAIERDPDQCARIARNAAVHEVDVEVIHGAAPGALGALDTPDGVFVGGGGPAVAAIVDTAAARGPRAIVVALATIERIGGVTEVLRKHGYATGGVQLSAARLVDLPNDVTRLAAQNPVFVLWGSQ